MHAGNADLCVLHMESCAYTAHGTVQAPVFRELYSEKKVVAEERRARVDNAPLGPFIQAFCQAAFANAYSHPVIGALQCSFVQSRAVQSAAPMSTLLMACM